MSLNPGSTPTTDDSKRTLAQLKKANFLQTPVTLWIVYKRRRGPDAMAQMSASGDKYFFAVRRLDMAPALAKRLARVVEKQIQDAMRLEAYSFEGAVEKNSVLVEPLSETGFSEILDAIDKATPNDVATSPKQLHTAYGYLLAFEPKSSQALYTFRRIQAGWRTIKMRTLINAFMKGPMLVTVDENEIFRFDERIDFFAAGASIFILDKNGFESALNFRIGMESKCKQLVQALGKTNSYENLDIVEKLSMSHVRWLKKLAGAQKSAKCLQPGWIDRMLAFCASKNFPVIRKDGKVILTEENCETIVRLMNSDLLEDPIDHDLFKIDGAKQQVA